MHRVRLLLPVLLLALGLPSGSCVAGPVAPADTAAMAVDSSRVSAARVPDTLLARFRNDPAFQYDPNEGGTWWRDVKRWLRAQIAEWVGGSAAGGWVLQVVFYLVLALLVGYAAYMLVQLRARARPPGRSSPEAVAQPRTAEEMQAIDFEARVENAVADGNYRRGVRLLYQWTLQRLDRAGAISWRPGKTNRAYVDELDANHRSAFAALTRLFERVWYGGAAVDADRFEQCRAQFEAFWDRSPASAPNEANADEVARAAPRSVPHTADRPSA